LAGQPRPGGLGRGPRPGRSRPSTPGGPVTGHQPDGLEDRIRDAYQSAARTVQTLQRTSPVLAAGSVRRPRRMNVLTPVAAAAAVIVVIAASVALPRLLAGAARNPAAP